MKLLRLTIRTALRALRRNKLRSGLTTLGIVIGVAAVIAMVSVGQGANLAVKAQIESLGTNLLMVVPGATTSTGVRSGWGGVSTLTKDDARTIAEECPSVAKVTVVKRQVVQVVYAEKNWSTLLQGASPTYSEVRDWPVASGEFFNDRDEATANRVAVLGQTIVEELFGTGVDPIGETIRVKGVPLKVIGVLAEKGQSSWGQDQDDIIMVPFATAERRVLGSEILGVVDQIHATAVDAASLDAASEEITEVLRLRHKKQRDEEDDFSVRNLNEMAEASRSASRVMTNLLLSVASISLLVGGIGIMNILLVSVTERTREIGLRMAVGAKRRHVLAQFLVEAIALSLAGGIAGVILGIGSSAAISSIAGWPTLVSPTAVGGALFFAALVGVVFGFYPARKAAALDPIAALRYE
jgi:ABC-type antimicrobial peptide transport system permease subunit